WRWLDARKQWSTTEKEKVRRYESWQSGTDKQIELAEIVRQDDQVRRAIEAVEQIQIIREGRAGRRVRISREPFHNDVTLGRADKKDIIGDGRIGLTDERNLSEQVRAGVIGDIAGIVRLRARQRKSRVELEIKAREDLGDRVER